MQEIKWVRCPVCGNKTRLQIRADTELKNTAAPFPGTYFSGIGNQTTPTPGTEKWN